MAAIDLDIQGLAGLRLLGTTHEEGARLCRQLGARPGVPARPPDLTLRFVDPLPARGRPLAEHETVAIYPDASAVLRSPGRKSALQLHLDPRGPGREVYCQPGGDLLPWLVPLLHLALLDKGWLLLHASAFEYRGHGVLLAGQGGSGKTQALLSFTLQGARYVGDDRILLQGGRMVGLPASFQVSREHLQHWPAARKALRKRRGRLFQAAYRLDRTLKTLTRWKFTEPFLQPVRRRLRWSLDPVDLLEPRQRTSETRLHRVFLLRKQIGSRWRCSRSRGKRPSSRCWPPWTWKWPACTSWISCSAPSFPDARARDSKSSAGPSRSCSAGPWRRRRLSRWNTAIQTPFPFCTRLSSPSAVFLEHEPVERFGAAQRIPSHRRGPCGTGAVSVTIIARRDRKLRGS